jgi:hypothetical protein
MYGPAREVPASDTILELTEQSAVLLEKSEAVVAEGLRQGLMRVVPPPDVLEGGEAALAKEVTAFVQDLLKVVQLKLLLTPVNELGETPADCVGSAGVTAEVNSVLGLTAPLPAMSTRLLVAVKDHQDERDERLKDLHATPTWAFVAVAVVLTLNTLLCYFMSCYIFDGLAAAFLGWHWVARLRSGLGRVFLALEALSCTAYPLRAFGVWPASWDEIGPSTIRPIYTRVSRELARWGWSRFKMPVLNGSVQHTRSGAAVCCGGGACGWRWPTWIRPAAAPACPPPTPCS